MQFMIPAKSEVCLILLIAVDWLLNLSAPNSKDLVLISAKHQKTMGLVSMICLLLYCGEQANEEI